MCIRDRDIGIVPYALVCNGGVLLVNGKRDREWYLESLQMIPVSYTHLQSIQRFMLKTGWMPAD